MACFSVCYLIVFCFGCGFCMLVAHSIEIKHLAVDVVC